LKVTLGNDIYHVRHRLRPPTAEDWFAYDAALAMAIEEVPLRPDGRPYGPAQRGAEPTAPAPAGPAEGPTDSAGAGYKLDLQSTEAAALLWDRLARGLDGYSLPAAPPGLPAQAGFAADAQTAGRLPATWHELVPLAHKEAAIRALTLVAPSNHGSGEHAAAFPLQAEQVPVVLEAVVAGRAYPRLLHTFRPPTAEDERSYRRLLAETLFVRGSRTARTLIPSRLPALCRLYDRLILGVEGYALDGQLLASRDQVIQHMDAWHKRTAVQALFSDATEPAPTAFAEAAP
ncbi:MAG: hypothetical protein ACE5H2_08490, partial [Terriglobia bacterium]